jgi:hypothetical protein
LGTAEAEPWSNRARAGAVDVLWVEQRSEAVRPPLASRNCRLAALRGWTGVAGLRLPAVLGGRVLEC